MNAKATGALAKILLALSSLLISAVVAECGLRLLPETWLGYHYQDGEFLWPREFDRQEEENSLGAHDLEPGPKDPNVRRLLLLGDSYVEAYSVPIPETVGKRLEHHLNASSRVRYEVVSIGESGWGQIAEARALARYGERLQPDIVLLLFLPLNDVEDNSPSLRRQAGIQFGRAQGGFRYRPGWVKQPAEVMPLLVFRGSELNRFVSYRLGFATRDQSSESIPVDYFVYAAEISGEWREAWKLTGFWIRKIRESADSLGASFLLASASTPQGVWGAAEGLEQLMQAYPGMRGMDWDLDQPDRMLAQLAAKQRIPFVALEPLLRAEQRMRKERLHWRYDGHWTAVGNDLAARHLAAFVLDNDSAAGSHP
jgi:hypothetical protein